MRMIGRRSKGVEWRKKPELGEGIRGAKEGKYVKSNKL